MCEYGNTTVLDLPDWIERNQRTVSIDNCAVGLIKHLWQKNIYTQGICCGHGKIQPSIVLGEHVDNIDVIKSIIKDFDGRNWQLLAWKLVIL